MKLFRMAAVLAVLTTPVFAQDAPHINLLADQPSKTDEEKERDAARDKAYKETLKKIPDAKASNDPWGGMRTEPSKPAAPPKASATNTAKKPKAGTAAN
ncbi:hypothetical protein JQ625_20055 [Bradyrhizobium diazoefficiens]|nr:hypothetical protein [Bradyrhizobium diazoefficiens]MBR0777139.1 hypothetical protein [Bradyrhizobium diazoefficiens]